ncbi:hypothetical protein [Pseudocitrobacter faecalis]|uniref:hypothetical protein n=1 Tax=Pseudocitrobacter faecalis TaxID=1398493 RepID=UPI003BA3AE5B
MPDTIIVNAAVSGGCAAPGSSNSTGGDDTDGFQRRQALAAHETPPGHHQLYRAE